MKYTVTHSIVVEASNAMDAANTARFQLGATTPSTFWVKDEAEKSVFVDLCNPKDDEEKPLTCGTCGAVEGTPEWGTVGDGYAGLCGNCADDLEEEVEYDRDPVW